MRSFYRSGERNRLLASLAVAAILALPSLADNLAVKTIPWSPSDRSVPHETFANRRITLKGTASADGATIQATWDFGDATAVEVFTVVDHNDVSTTHVYTGFVGASFTARLTVRNLATGESASEDYPIVMRAQSPATEANVAIDEGL